MPFIKSHPRPNKPNAWESNQSLRFPFVKPRIPTLDKVAPHFSTAVDAGWYSNFGPVSIALECEVEEDLLANGTAVACSSCTSGLTAALYALAVDRPVLIPAFTFQATASSVVGAGLSLWVGDVEPETGILSAEAVHEAVRKGCGAIVLVRPYGIWSNISTIAGICQAAGVPLLIDNAAGLGVSKQIDQTYGVPGAIEVFSLHATKPFGVGEGGILRVPAQLESRVRAALNFGLSLTGENGKGLNGKMPELTSAVALAAKAELAPRILDRQKMASAYANWAAQSGFRHFAHEVEASPWQCFPVVLPSQVSAEAVSTSALAKGLQLRRYYQPMHGVPAALAANELSAKVICLPIYDGKEAESAEEIWSIFLSAVH